MSISKKKQREKEAQKNYVMSQSDVAHILGISKQAVQVTEKRALRKIKEYFLIIYTQQEVTNFISNKIVKNLP
jgi:transcriptional regulator